MNKSTTSLLQAIRMIFVSQQNAVEQKSLNTKSKDSDHSKSNQTTELRTLAARSWFFA